MNAQFLRLCREFVAVQRHKFKSNPRDTPFGWHELGSGFYSEVFEHCDHPGLVLKISGPGGWGYERDSNLRWAAKESGGVRADMWPLFAQHCMAYPHKHFPKIMHFERTTQRMAWAVMPAYQRSLYAEEADFEFVRHVRSVLVREKQPGPGEQWLWPLIELSQHRFASVDLHSANWMLDSSGNVIITDPFSATGADTGYGSY